MKNIAEEIVSFEECLYLEEKSENTIKKYIRDVNAFIGFLGIKTGYWCSYFGDYRELNCDNCNKFTLLHGK